jgi:hypothetical protein
MTDMENDERPEQEPAGENERELLQQDLVDVEKLKELLGPKGIKGAVFYCPDCGEDHYLTWDLLSGNLKELLDEGESPVHEPAFEPDPDDYVSWDYGRGYLDGYETFEQEKLPLTAARLVNELSARDWQAGEIKALLAALGLRDVSRRGGG